MFGTHGVRDPIARAHADARITEPDCPLAGDDVNRLLVRAMEVQREGAFAGGELEELTAELLVASVRPKAPTSYVELALAHVHGLDLVLIDDVRVSSRSGHVGGFRWSQTLRVFRSAYHPSDA